MKFKNVLNLILVFTLCSCAGGIQKTYWGAGNTVAFDEEQKGNFETAENEYKRALWRAENHLTENEVSDSLYNLGAFYRRQERIPDAIKYLEKSVAIEESLSGPSSEKTGRRLAELSVAYYMDGNWNKGKELADRLKPLTSLYSGSELEFVNKLINEYNKGDELYKKEIAQLVPLAQKGDAEAQYNLAAYYEDGRGVKQDCNRALELYKAAADQELVIAQYYLGVIYDKGRCAEPNQELARQWYKIAAEKGFEIAQYNYGIYLFYGRGGSKDEESGLKWLKRSADQGNPSAISALKDLDSPNN